KAADEIKANAQNMFDGVKDEASFISQSYAYATESSKEAYKDNAKTLMANITKENIKSNISEDASKWAYEDTRVVGDKKLFTVENEDGSVTCYAIYLVKPQYRDETLQPVDVRHILVAFDPDVEDGKEVKVTDELKAEKLKQAEALLEKWKSGKATEKSFGDLAKKSSDDTGTAEKGGLIKDITKSSQYVKPFLDWCFVNDRKAGNTGIVESTYGYHIMYCSNVSDKPEWQNKIISSLVDKKNNDFFNNYIKKAEKKIVVKEKKIEKVKADMEKIAGRMISNA
ncbi:MAG: peptidylprolyl isomerase, partial [Oscillospiraceae bacterium]